MLGEVFDANGFAEAAPLPVAIPAWKLGPCTAMALMQVLYGGHSDVAS